MELGVKEGRNKEVTPEKLFFRKGEVGKMKNKRSLRRTMKKRTQICRQKVIS